MISIFEGTRRALNVQAQLVEMLSRAEFELFVWEETDLKDFDPQVKVIGALLEVSQKLYLDLQNMYN